MTDREKLMQLIAEAKKQWDGGTNNIDARIADHLIANSVIIQKWILVSERLPEEHDSIWAAYYGTDKWENWMTRKISDEVAAEITYDNGGQTITKVRAAYTVDGEWRLSGGTRLHHSAVVNRWTPMPEPPKEVL